MMSRFKLLACLSFLLACKEKDTLSLQYEEGKQILSVNGLSSDGTAMKPPTIGKMCPDSIALGNELLVKVFLLDNDFRIVNAFIDCNAREKSMADTATFKIDGCSQQLMVKSDTVFIGFSPNKAGIHSFPSMVILTQDKQRVLRSYSYEFQYKVFEE